LLTISLRDGTMSSMTDPQFRPKYVSFDCYGTLISWPMTPISKELVGDQVPAEQWDQFVAEFRGYRYDQVLGEYYPYEQVLQDSFDRVCRRWGIEPVPGAGKRFADGVRSWGPHPDVPAPLKTMGEHYKLVILSNAGDSFLAESVPRLGADFHAVFTAEQAGYYKPRYAAFEYMLDQLDATPQDFVHVSSHTRYDPLPMHDMGFRNLVLLDRGYDPVPPGYGLTVVKTLDELNTLLGI
jgi:2-haloacid dehalogenase